MFETQAEFSSAARSRKVLEKMNPTNFRSRSMSELWHSSILELVHGGALGVLVAPSVHPVLTR